MGISDWFKPKWRHGDPAKRTEAVEKIEDISILKKILREDSNNEVRIVALRRINNVESSTSNPKIDTEIDSVFEVLKEISDPDILLDTMRGSNETKLHQAIIEKINHQKSLYEIVIDAFPFQDFIRLEALQKITDSRYIDDLFKADLNEGLISALIRKTNDQNKLLQVFHSDRFTFANRMTAANLVTDHQVIKNILEIETDPDIVHHLIDKPDIKMLGHKDFLSSLFYKYNGNYAKGGSNSQRKKIEKIMVKIVELTSDETTLYDYTNNADNYAARAASKKIQNPSLIEKMARESKDWSIRRMAVRKLRDQDLLETIATNDEIDEVRKAAEEELCGLLFKDDGSAFSNSELKSMALTNPFEEIRKCAIKQIKEPNVLIDAARNDKCLDIRKYAARQLSDDQMDAFIYIATNDENPDMRAYAIDKIFDEKLLSEIVIKESHYATAARAIKKIIREDLIAGIAKKAHKPYVRDEAIKKISTDKVLADLYKNETDSEVRRKIQMKIKDPAIHEEIRKTDSSTDSQPELNVSNLAPGTILISDTQNIHFNSVVPMMNQAGAKRLGSKNIQSKDGQTYLVDIYLLPNGSEVMAGYPNPYL